MRKVSVFVLSLASLLALTSVALAVRTRVEARMGPVIDADASGAVRSESDTDRPSRNRLEAQFELFSMDFAELGVDPGDPAASNVVLCISTGAWFTMTFAEDRRNAGVGDVTWEISRRGSSAPVLPAGATASVKVNGTPVVEGLLITR
jgi:hypothetical protein